MREHRFNPATAETSWVTHHEFSNLDLEKEYQAATEECKKKKLEEITTFLVGLSESEIKSLSDGFNRYRASSLGN